MIIDRNGDAGNLLTLRALCRPASIEVRGNRWEVIDMGRSRVPLVFLPDITGTSEVFYKQILWFGRRQRVISAAYPALRDPGAIVASLADLLKHLDIERVNLVGVSLGGYIAQHFIESHTGHVRHCVISNSFSEARRIIMAPGIVRAMASANDRAALQAMYRQPGEQKEYAGGFAELLEIQMAMLNGACYAARLKERFVTLSNCGPVARSVGNGVTIVDCEDDPVVDALSRLDLRDRYPAARVYSLSHGGHCPHIVNAGSFNEILEDEFLTGEIH
jgi:pimeloyl-ACP methyl ester carboxylesterase